MERKPTLAQRLAKLQTQRWRREALLAVLLTIAALAFIAAAIVGTDFSDQAKAPTETAGKPQR
jgi:hypothetical protein